MFIPAAVQLEMLVSNAHAKTAFNQCFLWLHIAASVTVAMPLKKKNKPMRISADLFKIGARAYMWKSAIRLKAPRTPSDRATTTGTPYFGRPYRKGAYAREVHGEAKALCHVSDQKPVKLSAKYNGPKSAGLLLYRSASCILVQIIYIANCTSNARTVGMFWGSDCRTANIPICTTSCTGSLKFSWFLGTRI